MTYGTESLSVYIHRINVAYFCHINGWISSHTSITGFLHLSLSIFAYFFFTGLLGLSSEAFAMYILCTVHLPTKKREKTGLDSKIEGLSNKIPNKYQ